MTCLELRLDSVEQWSMDELVSPPAAPPLLLGPNV